MKKIKRSKANEGRSWRGKKKCTHCGGSGYHGETMCPEWDGSGFVKKKVRKKRYSLDQKMSGKADYGGEMFKVENWMPDKK